MLALLYSCVSAGIVEQSRKKNSDNSFKLKGGNTSGGGGATDLFPTGFNTGEGLPPPLASAQRGSGS